MYEEFGKKQKLSKLGAVDGFFRHFLVDIFHFSFFGCHVPRGAKSRRFGLFFANPESERLSRVPDVF